MLERKQSMPCKVYNKVTYDLEEFQLETKKQQKDTRLKLLKFDDYAKTRQNLGLDQDLQFERELNETIQASLIDQRISQLIVELELDFFETDSF
ncbi:hypothetical protein HDV01_000984 [Terramyces sp. JEL0728]|nr:hypothetical protein HDV01_000984 [Terramyces sp. JEL0728]